MNHPALKAYRKVARPEFFRLSLVGIVGDILQDTFPQDSPLIIGATIGQVKQLAGFWTDDWLVRELLNTFQSRLFRLGSQHTGFEPVHIPPEVFAFWYAESERQKETILPTVKKALAERFGTPAADEIGLRALQQQVEVSIREQVEHLPEMLRDEVDRSQFGPS